MTAYTRQGTPTKRDSIDMNAKPFQLPKNSTLLKDYRAKNREKIAKYQKEYQAKNKDFILKQQKNRCI
jgi:hypothetical protein